jgi:hypothetical protein
MTAALAAALAFAAPAAAREDRGQVGRQGTIAVDPDMSYIFFRSSARVGVQFVREPTAEERRLHAEARAEAYAIARTRSERQLASWQREREECRGHAARDASYCRYPPAQPAMVTPETFAYPPIEMETMVMVAAGPQFTREEPGNTYLMRVKPGTYTLYGSIAFGDGGAVGVCLCMGSVRFEAPVGRIVDIGELRYPAEGAGEPPRRNMTTQVLVPPSESAALPARLAGMPVVRAELRAADKLPNFLAVEIDRHPPIEDVLGYDRDRVIDLRAAAAPATGG